MEKNQQQNIIDNFLARSIIERANSGIYLIDSKGRILDVNPKAAEILGYTRTELTQLTIADIDAEVTPEIWNEVWERLKEEETERLERIHIRKDRSIIPIELYSSYLQHEGREFAIAFVQDISLRKQKEEEMREKDILLHDVGEQAKIGAWKVDLETGKATSTDGVSRIYGLKRKEEIHIEEGLNLYFEDSRRMIDEAFYNACHKGIPYDLELEIISAEGEHKWVRTTGYPAIREGEIIRVQGLFQDITDIKNAEILLKKSERKYRNLIELSPLGIGIIDQEGHIIDANQSIASMLGYDVGELLSLTTEDISHPEEFPLEKKLIGSLIRNEKKSFSLEKRYRHKDGRYLWVNVTVSRTENLFGRGIFFSVFCEDINSRKEMERERKKLEEQLTHSRKMEAIGQLAGGVAHDFNNMLSGILAAADLALQSEELKESAVRDYLNMIIESSEKASKLISQLLAFSRKEITRKEEIDIHGIVREMISILSRTINKKIKIHQNLEALSTVVFGEPSSLLNAFLNLSINASHAMKNGGDLSISTNNIILDEKDCRKNLFSLQPGKFLQIEISDTGTGISPEIIDRIFEPFFTTKDIGEGSGLGLSVVYGTIENHKGAITVDSAVGKGTSFYIFLPCSE